MNNSYSTILNRLKQFDGFEKFPITPGRRLVFTGCLLSERVDKLVCFDMPEADIIWDWFVLRID